MNSRLESLFDILNINDRWINNFQDVEKILNIRVDYTVINNLLEKYREKSLGYINKILG